MPKEQIKIDIHPLMKIAILCCAFWAVVLCFGCNARAQSLSWTPNLEGQETNVCVERFYHCKSTTSQNPRTASKDCKRLSDLVEYARRANWQTKGVVLSYEALKKFGAEDIVLQGCKNSFKIQINFETPNKIESYGLQPDGHWVVMESTP